VLFNPSWGFATSVTEPGLGLISVKDVLPQLHTSWQWIEPRRRNPSATLRAEVRESASMRAGHRPLGIFALQARDPSIRAGDGVQEPILGGFGLILSATCVCVRFTYGIDFGAVRLEEEDRDQVRTPAARVTRHCQSTFGRTMTGRRDLKRRGILPPLCSGRSWNWRASSWSEAGVWAGEAKSLQAATS
jgi:hypothetical protein